MIENLVGAWLTDASERSYEAAFGQLLVIEGHRVVQGPMHHSHEHGKDIIAYDPAGDLCVYQLKGGSGKLDTKGVEAVQDQLHAAAVGAVDHPSLPEPTVPRRVFLVTNQSATGPAQGRIRTLSQGYRRRGFASVHLSDLDDLRSRFVAAQGRFFPSAPEAVKTFLGLFLADGRGPFLKEDFFGLLEKVLPVSGAKPRAAEAQRAISAAALVTAFSLRPWAEEENHAEVAVGWLAFCSQLLRVAQRARLGKDRYFVSYRLALEEARRRLSLLLGEAVDADDLVIPDLPEPLVYAARATKVAGLSAALTLSLRIDREDSTESEERMRRLFDREKEYLRVVSEAEAPLYLCLFLVLSQIGRLRESTQRMFMWIGAVCEANHPDSDTPLADPYHEVEEALLSRLDPLVRATFDDEDFAGASYSLYPFVRCAVRRLWRQTLARFWDGISRVECRTLRVEHPIEMLYHRAPNGTLESWYFARPTSWNSLLAEANTRDPEKLPPVLLEHPEFLPFFAVVFPHRFTPELVDMIDDLATSSS